MYYLTIIHPENGSNAITIEFESWAEVVGFLEYTKEHAPENLKEFSRKVKRKV